MSPKVVKPFFFGHFARLDRQIVLVDALTALNAGAGRVADLQRCAESMCSPAFRQGANSWASALFGRRIDRILFAATKADLLHHTSHDRLEAILEADREGRRRRAPNFPAPISTLPRSPPSAPPARRR